MRKTLLLALSLPVLISGCQSWGPTWSELSGQRYPTGEINQFRRPAIIENVDNQGAFPSYPIKIEPGQRRIVLSADAPGWPGGPGLEVMNLDAAPCKRYYLNAQFQNNISPQWTPVIDWAEDIAGCKIDAKK